VPKSYELSEVAREYLPGALKDPERWLRRKLNARVFPGTRVGRHWVMTDHQIQAMLECSAPRPRSEPHLQSRKLSLMASLRVLGVGSRLSNDWRH